MTIITNDENNNNNNNNNNKKKKIVSFFYLLKSCDVWHDKLGYVNYNFMQRFINPELLPIMIFEKNHKYEIFIESKF
jgi:hypothetical protein